MRHILLSISLLLVSTLLSAELYRWVDEKGNVHFSDTQINSDAQVYTPPPILTVPAVPAGNFSSKTTSKSKKFKYESITLTSPADGATFPTDTESIQVSIQVKPGLNTKEKNVVALYMNGKLHQKGSSLSYSFKNLDRGAHTVYATIETSKGKKIKQSAAIQFYVQRHHL